MSCRRREVQRAARSLQDLRGSLSSTSPLSQRSTLQKSSLSLSTPLTFLGLPARQVVNQRRRGRVLPESCYKSIARLKQNPSSTSVGSMEPPSSFRRLPQFPYLVTSTACSSSLTAMPIASEHEQAPFLEASSLIPPACCFRVGQHPLCTTHSG